MNCGQHEQNYSPDDHFLFWLCVLFIIKAMSSSWLSFVVVVDQRSGRKIMCSFNHLWRKGFYNVAYSGACLLTSSSYEVALTRFSLIFLYRCDILFLRLKVTRTTDNRRERTNADKEQRTRRKTHAQDTIEEGNLES